MKNLTIIFICLLYTMTSSAQDEGTPDIIRGDDKFILAINTVEDATENKIDDVEVYLYDTKTSELLATKSTTNGVAYFNIDPIHEYEIRTCNTGYLKNGLSIYECNEGNEVLCTFGGSHYNFVASGGKDKPAAMLQATISLKAISVGSIFELENVYYDLDKSALKPEGKEELDELVSIMQRNKSISIELSSHTDSRASNEYNIDLSQARAQSCFDYLTSKGIAASRIKTKGYGESKLLNKCSDNVTCTEAQHQINRRTEIEVLSYEPIACAPSLDVDFKIKDLKNDADDKGKPTK